MPNSRFFYRLMRFVDKLSKYRTTVMVMAVVVVFITTYLLILPALTLEKNEAEKQGGIDISATEAEAESPSDEVPDTEVIKETGTKSNAGHAETVSDQLSFEGNSYKVSVIDEKGVLPDGTSVNVEEIDKKESAEDYDNYYKEALAAIQNEEGGGKVENIVFAHFYDITLTSKGREVEPAEGDKVNVKIEYEKTARKELGIKDSDNVRIIHFTEDEKTGKLTAEVLDAEENGILVETDNKDLLQSAEFETGSFSVYAVVYTVDFHYEVNGKVYEFSIPGGGYVSFSQLVEVLGIAHQDAGEASDAEAAEDILNENTFLTLDEIVVTDQTRAFIADVENIDFTRQSYLSVSKVEKNTTVGAIKSSLGLKCKYSAELPDELIAEIDAQPVESGDWALISVLPFDTEETLTVTMKDGEVWTIAVTDANANARKASLISAASIQNNQQLVIYQKVIQPDDSILYYAIDGNGNLQRVYNSSDSVYWLNDPSIVWKVTTLSDGSGNPTGYYTLYNETTGTYLVPKNDNGAYRVIHSLSDFSDGDLKHVNVSLPGKDAGQYLSKIASWDYDANTTYGIEVTTGSDVHAKELLSSQDFYFATPEPITQGSLTPVDTVDSLAKGIKITMYDFNSNEWQKEYAPRYSFMTRNIGDSSYLEGVYHPGLVRPVLGADGFPVSTATGNSISPVFTSQGNYYSTSSDSWDTPGPFFYNVSKTENVNHLFLQSVYDATGYFYYSCFENYAQLRGSDFAVYEQLGTPWDGDEFFFKRGNFTPYDSLDLSRVKSNLTSNSSSSELGVDNPRRGEDLYVINGGYEGGPGANYYFGMIMEADFIQGQNGYNDRDEPTVFEFNGDDDLWVYIDNVLVLDIGGVHDAFKGTIDFKTGDVIVEGGSSTTIKALYRNAGLFPDGSTYVESRASEYFTGNTFKDYSTHSLKMFYLERGAAASNLEIKFNLMPIKESSFRVTKEMPETATGDVLQNDYADAIFYYNAYIGDAICTQQAFGSTAVYADGTPVLWKDNTTFQLKHGQTAIFPVSSNTVRYHVVEVEPEANSTMLDHYDVTNSDPEPGQQSGKEVLSSEKSVQQRGEVVYRNRPDDSIVNELRIVKELTGEMYTDEQGNLLVNEETGSPYFEYRIFLENTAGKMVYYSLGEYYQIDIDGKYVYYENGVRKTAEYNNGQYIYRYSDGTVETLNSPKITEHTSQNGTIGDIRHGDTIIIRGLLEGTDFIVDERTDRSLMLKGTTGEDSTEKYSFDETTVEDAYIRETGDNMPTYPTGTLYNPPVAPDWPYSEKAAKGTIIQSEYAKITVKNSSTLINADLTLKKVTEDGTPIEGAVFKLIRGNEIVPLATSGDGVVIEPLVPGETVTITDNKFTVPEGGVKILNLPAGTKTYKLVEVSPPAGYLIIDETAATFKVESGEVIIISSAQLSNGSQVTFANNVLTVPNIPGAALPNTGGIGTTIFYIFGSMLVLGCSIYLIARRRAVR